MSFTSGAVLTASALNTFVPGNKIKNAVGSASDPTYTFDGDANTGMFRGSSSDELAFSTGGTQRLTIKSDGDVGIGTSNPSVPLHVATGGGDHGIVVQSTDSVARINMQDNSSTDAFAVGVGATGNNLSLFAGSAEKVTVASDGDVGIGTTTPAGDFELTANTSEMIFSSSPNKTNRYRFDANFTDSADFGFSTSYWDGSAYVRAITLLPNGNVGIGTTSPATPLHVSSGGSQAIRLTNTTSSTQGPYIGFFGSTTRVGYAGFPNNDDFYINNETSAGHIYFRTDNTTRLEITDGGVVQWSVSSGIGGPLTATSSTSGYRYVLRNQTFGTLFEFSSDRDRKDQITNVTTADSARWIDALQPVTYIERWLGEGNEPADNKQWREADVQVGFIADDVLASTDTSHFAQATDNGEGGLDPSGWKWETVIAAAVAEIKSLRARVATLEA